MLYSPSCPGRTKDPLMTGRQDLFDESMRLGHSAAWEMQWDRAIEYYRKALAEFPDDASALMSLGLALYEGNQHKEALSIYHRASKVSPDDPIPIEKCAEIFERLEQIDDAVAQRKTAATRYLRTKDAMKAIENWTHIARLVPDDLATRSRLALTYERIGRTSDALSEYLSVAAILQKSGKLDRAYETVQRCLQLAPDNPDANHAMRLLQQKKSLPAPSQPRGATAPLRMEKVKKYLRADEEDELPEDDSQQADPETVSQRQAMTILAGMLFDEPSNGDEQPERTLDMGDLTKGRLSRERRSIGQPQMYRYLGQAIDLQSRGHDSQAMKEYERAIKAGLDHPAAHYVLGILYKTNEKFKDAQRELTAALGHPELDLGANLALGRLARMRNDLPEAARHLLQALRLADNLSVDDSQSGQLNDLYDTIQASQDEGDEETLSKIVESTLSFLSGPEWMRRLRQARMQLEHQGETAAVVPIAEMLAVGGTEKVLESITLIDEYISHEQYACAMEEAMLALDYVPTYLGLHIRMAEAMMQSGRVEEALTKYHIIAKTHLVRADYKQAADIYQRIVGYAPVDIDARAQLIELLVRLEKNELALQQYLEMAELYRQLAEIDRARKTLADALKLAQESPVGREYALKILHMLGDIDSSKLDWRKALRVYEQIRTLDPRDENARMQVIDLNLRLGSEEPAAKELDEYMAYLVEEGRGSEALTLLENMAREHPGKQALHRRLADAYRAADRIADAIAQYDALGEIQLDAGDLADAIHTIETIIELNPPDMEGYQDLLSNLRDSQT